MCLLSDISISVHMLSDLHSIYLLEYDVIHFIILINLSKILSRLLKHMRFIISNLYDNEI